MDRTRIADEIRARAEGRSRFLVAIAGAPGSGKSTLAAKLATALGDGAAVLPMDGFHLDNDTLRARGLFARKGAPETFDCAGFAALLTEARKGGALSVPTFDRTADAVMPDGDTLPENARIVLVEGNYLLLDAPCWRDLAPLFDLTVSIDVPEAVLKARLVKRWLDHGMPEADAERRAETNDMANARLVTRQSLPADLSVSVDS